MNQSDIIKILGFSAPLFSSIICGLLLISFYFQKKDHTGKSLALYGSASFITSAICWFSFLMYITNYHIYIFIHPLLFFCLLFNQVYLYKITYTITITDKEPKFSALHYIFPIILGMIMLIGVLITPYEVQYTLVEKGGLKLSKEYFQFSLFYISIIPIFFFYNLGYSFMSLSRINNYRKIISNYSSDINKSSVRWLYLAFFLFLITIPLPALSLFMEVRILVQSFLITLFVLFFVFQHILICFNIINNNYTIINLSDDETVNNNTKKNLKLNREKFEEYIFAKKPYLNPELKITDLSNAFSTNRTYISSFINTTYNMTFCSYINACRLREIEQIASNPENAKKESIILVQMAGFRDYRSYIRIRKDLEKRSRIR